MPAPHSQSAARTGREKVAILLLALGEDMGKTLLKKFAPADVRRIMDSASALGHVDRQNLESLVDEFAAHFAQAIGLGTGFDALQTLLEQAFSPAEITSMLGKEAIKAGEPAWRRFSLGMENSLVPYLLDEHPQTVAFVLSNFDSEFAARCLSILPGDFRMTVTRRLLTQAVSKEVEDMVDQMLQRDLLLRADAGLEAEGRNRLAAMLNRLDREQTGEIIAGVAAWKPDEAAKLRRMIFSFEDIAKLTQPSRLALFDKLQTEQVIAALKGMPAEIRELALSALGARARRLVEAELAGDKGGLTPEGDAARSAIAAMALGMSQRGELELPSDDAG